MKRLMNVLVAMSLALVYGFGFAANSKIAVVDLQKIMQDSAEMKNVQQKLEKKFMPKREKLMKMEENLKTELDKLKRDGAVLSDAKKKEMQQKIMEQKQAFDKEGQEYQQELSAAHNKAVQNVYEKVKDQVANIAKQKGFDLVLQKDAATFSASSLDITDEVLNKMK